MKNELNEILGSLHKNNLTAAKTEKLVFDGDFQISGFILTAGDGRVAFVDHARVSWLSEENMKALMGGARQNLPT